MSYLVSFIKSITAFCAGIVLTLIFYYYVHIPVLPCVSVQLIALFLNDGQCRFFRRLFVIIGALLGIACYLGNAILSIIHFPAYSNIFGIVFDFITAFAFLSAGFTMFIGLGTE